MTTGTVSAFWQVLDLWIQVTYIWWSVQIWVCILRLFKPTGTDPDHPQVHLCSALHPCTLLKIPSIPSGSLVFNKECNESILICISPNNFFSGNAPIDVLAVPSLDCEGLWRVCICEQWLATTMEVMIIDRTLIWKLAQCGWCDMCDMGCMDPANPNQILLPSRL
jgi:hypothetical protein